jgi:hypothetical protein
MFVNNNADNELFLFAYILSIIMFGILLHTSGISLLKPSIPMVFLWSYLILGYIGFLLLVFRSESAAVRVNVTNQDVIILTWFYSALSLICIMIGINIGKYALQIQFSTRAIAMTRYNARLPVFVIVILCIISILSLGIYIRIAPSIALFEYLQYGESANIALARSSATNALPNAWRYQFFTTHITPFLSYVTLAAFVMTSRKTYMILFVITFLLSSSSAVMNFTRSTLPIYFSSVIFIYILSKQALISWRVIIFGLSLVMPFLLFAFAITVKIDLGTAFEVTLERLLTGTPEAAYFYVIIFPNTVDYLYGLSLPNPGGILPFEHFRLSVFVSQYIWNFVRVYGGGPAQDVVGSAPAMFWTEMYANFGITGIVSSSLLFGCFLWVIHAWSSSLPRHPVFYGLITYFAFYIRPVSTSFLSNILVPVEPIIVCAVAYIIYRLSKDQGNTNLITKT